MTTFTPRMVRVGEGRGGIGQSMTHRCEVPFVVNGSQVVEELEGSHEGLGCRGVHEVKVNLREGKEGQGSRDKVWRGLHSRVRVRVRVRVRRHS